MTFISPFQVRIGGNDSAVIGGSAQAYTNANIQTAINAIAGFAGHGDRHRRRLDRLHGHLRRRLGGHRRAELLELVNLNCGGCFASVEETNHGGANDSFTLNYNGNMSAPIVNGTNYTAAGILARAHADPAGRRDRDGRRLRRRQRSTTPGFQVTLRRHAGGDERAGHARRCTNLTAGASGFVGETDKGGAVDNKGGTITPTGDAIPVVDGAGRVHDPAADAVRPDRAARPTPTATRCSTAGSRTTAARRGHRRC